MARVVEQGASAHIESHGQRGFFHVHANLPGAVDSSPETTLPPTLTLTSELPGITASNVAMLPARLKNHFLNLMHKTISDSA
jgi:hypothetical protein